MCFCCFFCSSEIQVTTNANVDGMLLAELRISYTLFHERPKQKHVSEFKAPLPATTTLPPGQQPVENSVVVKAFEKNVEKASNPHILTVSGTCASSVTVVAEPQRAMISDHPQAPGGPVVVVAPEQKQATVSEKTVVPVVTYPAVDPLIVTHDPFESLPKSIQVDAHVVDMLRFKGHR